MFQLVNRSPANVLADSVALQGAAASAAQPAPTFDSTAVEALVKKIKALSAAPSIWGAVATDLAYGKDLQAAYKVSLSKATSAAASAATDAAAAAKTVPATAPSP